MKKNLERTIYTYRITSFEEKGEVREFVVCDILVKDKLLYSNQRFPYKFAEKHNLINIGDEFTYLLDDNQSPTLENIMVLYRKEEPKTEEKVYPTNYNHNGLIFPLH